MRIPMILVLLLLLATIAVAKEWAITLTDYSGRGFAPDLVTYTAPMPAGGVGQFRLLSPDGQAQPVQAVPSKQPGMAEVSFVTGLPANGTITYTLRDDGGKEPPKIGSNFDASPVSVFAELTNAKRKTGRMQLTNGMFNITVPDERGLTYANPIPANTLPAPLIAWGAGGELGAGRILTDRPVKAFRVKLLAGGPVYAEMRYEIDFADGGYYHANVRVIDRVPLAMVTEEYDLGVDTGKDFWELSLTKGWTPDSVETMKAVGNGGYGEMDMTLADYLKGAAADKPFTTINPDNCWGNVYSYVGLFNAAAKKDTPDKYPMVGFVPLHKGDWRRYNAVELWSDGKDLRVRLPIGVHPPSWLVEVDSNTSPMSTQEHDPALPATYGRRVWGLQLGAPALKVSFHGTGPFYAARASYGIVGLDRYKDYQLSWPDGKTTYPRVFLKPEQIEKYKAALATYPPAEQLLKKTYCLTGDPAIAKARAAQLKQQLTGIAGYLLSTPALGHHQTYVWVAVMADDVLSWPDLPADQKADLRARLALVTYLHAEPDMMAHGTGTHTGNPNMGYARQMDMLDFMALLPDHPAFPAWRDYMAGFYEYKTGEFMAPGGGWFEFGAAYHQHSLEKTSRNFNGLKASGAANIDAMYNYLRPELDYYMNLLTPYDSRWFARMIPGGANSCPGYSEIYLEAMAAMEEKDPEFAANLRWAWENNGKQTWGYGDQFNPLLGRPYIAAKEPQLGSKLVPGVGVIFRAHQGPDETYLFLRSGYNWSHWYANDQNSLILYSRGAALLPFQPYQYYTSPIADYDQYNVLRFGHPENQYEMGWPDTNILDHAFGPTVDYAWSSTGYQEWYITPGIKPEFSLTSPHKLADGIAQQQGPFTWNRQVLFLKGQTPASPNYFVFRDTTVGDGKLASWFNLNLIGRKGSVAVDGAHLGVTTEWPTGLDLYFAQQEPLQVDMKEEDEPLIIMGYNTPGWFQAAKGKPVSPNWTRADGKPASADAGPDRELHVHLRIPGAPGQERLWLAYPRVAGEAAPTLTTLAPGVVKIVTPESTDYVFLSTTPITFTGENVTFQGCAGAVRLGKDAVTLALTGGAGKVGYKNTVIASESAFEQTLPLKKLKKGVTTLPAPQYGIAYTPQLTGHQEIVPGVKKAVDGNTVEFLIDSPTPVVYLEKRVRFEARKAAILISPKGTRFVALDGAYANLSVGTDGVRGLGPFDLTFTPLAMTGAVDGAMRSLAFTRPQAITRPMYHLDGVRWYAAFADDATPDDGLPTPQFNMALAVTDGRHAVDIREWVFPKVPTPPARKGVE